MFKSTVSILHIRRLNYFDPLPRVSSSPLVRLLYSVVLDLDHDLQASFGCGAIQTQHMHYAFARFLQEKICMECINNKSLDVHYKTVEAHSEDDMKEKSTIPVPIPSHFFPFLWPPLPVFYTLQT